MDIDGAVGAAVSRLIVSFTIELKFPAESRKRAYTVFVPSVEESVQAKGFAYESIRHFIDCLASGEEFLVSLEDAVNTSLVILSIFESVRTGEPEKVETIEALSAI